MYSYIKGDVINIEDSKVSILAFNSGIGLEISVSPILLSKIKIGDFLELSLYHHITDVSETLFGFESGLEKKVFKNLLKIDGIGGKAAINILGIGVNTLAKAIEENDDKLISTIPGIGKKTALKIILEMKSKVEVSDLFQENNNITLAKPYDKDIIDTLTGMGYDKKRVEEVIKSIPDDIYELKDKIIYSIKMLS